MSISNVDQQLVDEIKSLMAGVLGNSTLVKSEIMGDLPTDLVDDFVATYCTDGSNRGLEIPVYFSFPTTPPKTAFLLVQYKGSVEDEDSSSLGGIQGGVQDKEEGPVIHEKIAFTYYPDKHALVGTTQSKIYSINSIPQLAIQNIKFDGNTISILDVNDAVGSMFDGLKTTDVYYSEYLEDKKSDILPIGINTNEGVTIDFIASNTNTIRCLSALFLYIQIYLRHTIAENYNVYDPKIGVSGMDAIENLQNQGDLSQQLYYRRLTITYKVTQVISQSMAEKIEVIDSFKKRKEEINDMTEDIRAELKQIKAELDARNVVTLDKYNQDITKIKGDIADRLSKIDLNIKTYKDLAMISKAYPNGADGLFVTDDGHRAVYRDGRWIDGGVFQSAGYPEVIEARVGTERLGAKKYKSLSEAINRQIDAINDLGNQSLSYQVAGNVGQSVFMPSEWEIGIKAGSTLQIKFDLKDDSDLSVIQVCANRAWFTSIKRQDFGTWQSFKLDKDIAILGIVVPDDKFSKGFNAEISFQVITAPMSNIRSEFNPLMFHEFPVSPSTSRDELKPNAITNIDFDKGSKIYIRLKSDTSEDVIKNYQITANGKFLTSFDNLNVWNEVVLTDETFSLGFQAFKESVRQDFDGTFQVAGETLGSINNEINRNSSKTLALSLPISVSAGVDNVNQTAVNNLDIPKGSKIRVRFATDCDPDLLEAYQIWANNKFLTSGNDANWHEITLPFDTTSLGYAFYGIRVHGDITGNLEILGESFNELYNMFDIGGTERSNGGLDSSMLAKLKQKEDQINTITNNITNGVNFIFMTDPHFPANDLLSKPMMKHVLEHTSAPFVLCGGDFPGAYGTKDDVLNSVKTVIDYQNSIGKDRFLSVQANHDFTIRKNPTENTGWTASNALVYDTLIRPNEAYLPSIQAGKEYYYIDILAQKTRIFMLNSMDGNPLAENTNAWGTQYVISQDQADWLVEKTKEKNGWKFIFICHVPCDSNLDSYHPNEEFFRQIAVAINGKQKLSFHDTGINEDADFTSTTNEVVTILSGHNHVDQSSFRDGVLSITTTSDARYSDGGWVRKWQLYTSPAFDVVSINYDDGTINTTRIGGGQDRVFSYVAPNPGVKINSLKLQPIAELAVNGTAKCVVDMATPVVPDAIEWSNNCFTWSSSNREVATVDTSGVITAHASGTATITVSTRDGRHSDHYTIAVG